MVLKEMRYEGVDWINLAHDRTSGLFLCTEQWTFEFHKTQGISWLPAETMSLTRGTLLHGVRQHKLTHSLQKPPMDPTFSQPNLYCTSVTLLWLCSSVACC